MRRILLSLSLMALFSVCVKAQDDIVRMINDYGTFDRWSVREVKESGIIGGNVEYLYEFLLLMFLLFRYMDIFYHPI